MGVLSKLAKEGVERTARNEAEDLAVRGAKKAAKKEVTKPAAKTLAIRGKSFAKAAPKTVPAAPRTVRAAVHTIEPRLEHRKGEIPKMVNLSVGLSPRRFEEPAPVSIYDLEGQPFMTSMADMSAAGDDILNVGDVPLNMPVSRLGGQDFMFDNPNAVWAADKKPAQDIVDLAQHLKTETGKDPLYLPWAMGPTAIDFAHMPRELMLQYAASNMGARGRNKLTREVQGLLPEFQSLDDPESIAAFQGAAGKQRGELNTLLDRYRDVGGMGIGLARAANTDLEQLGLPLTSLRNVGRVEAGHAPIASGHPSYRSGVPGHGVGRLQENIGALQLMPDLMEAYGLSDPFGFPVGVVKGVPSPLRTLQLNIKGGVITDKALRAIQDREAALAGIEP